MRIVFFCHSLLSDWNHGHAHFLRGIVTELAARAHDVRVFEPRDAWSVTNLVREHGEEALALTLEAYPLLRSYRYERRELDLDEALDRADLVIVHEWNDHELVARIGRHRRRAGSSYRLLFHDTHHRSVTDERAMSAYDLSGYDAVLAFGAAVREVYACKGWAKQAFIWHEAADTRVFHPMEAQEPRGDVVWIGNWGDEARSRELVELLLEPVRDERLRACAHGVRYPETARAALRMHGVEVGGWLANFRVPETFAQFRMTVHVPRRPYVESLPGIPTIRVFEALACGIPLASAHWDDDEGLFTPGRDYLVARDGREMRRHLRLLASEPGARREIAERGLRTILDRHTCAHRADELLAIARSLGAAESSAELHDSQDDVETVRNHEQDRSTEVSP
jgi:spore maturation protein CgeB